MRRKSFQLLAALMLLALSVGCNSTKLPEQLIGVWRTENVAYKGKFMKCDPKYVVLGIGDEKVVPRKVVEITSTVEGRETLYTLKTDEKDEGEYSFSFYYSADDGGTIRFKNQPQLVWHKREIEVE